MDRITIRDLEVFAHHGALPHERELGQRFVLDLVLELDLAPAGRSDDLTATVHYGELAGDVAALVAADPVDLIETVAERVAERCLADPRVQATEVTVRKPAAPLPVLAREVAVTIRRQRA
ncbi:dihydroneopterin aldolase [Nitriliruptoraceae bacterium ZYF776]|nr:dihydroneopterin aldolase [Profundirhabdus halotolerans]